MSVLIEGSYDRSKQVPGSCRKCSCSEFLAIGSTRNTKYTGYEVCLGCPHKANQHIWNDIEKKVRISVHY